MSPDPAQLDLNNTVSAKWRRRLTGDRTEEKTHWRTKTAYYRAVAELIATRPRPLLTWRSIIGAVRPSGSRSTFYEVTGPRAKHALMHDIVAAASTDSLQLALCYQRGDAVNQLIDETKVWSYWPYREGWLAQGRENPDNRASVDSLLAVVATWARRNPELAAALDHAPPACAVEDLVVLHRGQLPAMRAVATLGQTMQAVVGPQGDMVDAAFGPLHELDITHRHSSTADSLIVGLAEQIYAMEREFTRLAPADTSAERMLATSLLLDAASQLA